MNINAIYVGDQMRIGPGNKLWQVVDVEPTVFLLKPVNEATLKIMIGPILELPISAMMDEANQKSCHAN